MGFSLKRFVKKAARSVGKLAKPLIKTAIQSTPLGAAAMKIQQTAKGLGLSFKSQRKVQPLSVRAAIERTAMTAPRESFEAPGPLGLVQPTRRRRRSLRPGAEKRVRMTAEAKTPKRKGSRKPPAGGLDLRAMGAAWRAAGKPGTWRDWIKTNQIRKAG